jgi:hypothetical protein
MFMVPLAVNDFITFVGTWVSGVLTINSLSANLGIYTAPGTKPAYVNCESVQYGISNPAAAIEVAETRAVAFVTDPSTTLQWFAIDVDPCTGATTERNILLLQPSQVAPLGRAVFRMGKALITPATAQVGFRLSTGTVTSSNNLTAGQFIQPIFNFIFPELLNFGDPPLTNNFETIPFLAQGSGPYIPGNPLTPAPTTCLRVGQLNPWPGAVAPPAANCPSPCAFLTPTSSAAPTSPTAPTVPDQILSATGSLTQTRGVITLNVQAQVNNPNSVLSVSAAGPNPIAPQIMIKGTTLTGGVTNWSLAVAVKANKPTSFTVTSSGGAAPVTKAV